VFVVGEQLREFVVDYLGPAFQRAKLDTEIWLGTLNTDDYDGTSTPCSAIRGLPAHRGVGFQMGRQGRDSAGGRRHGREAVHANRERMRLTATKLEHARYVFNLSSTTSLGVERLCYWNINPASPAA